MDDASLEARAKATGMSVVQRKELDNKQAVIRERDIKAGRAWIYEGTSKEVTPEEFIALGVDPNLRIPFPDN